MIELYKEQWRKCVTFEGRSTRKEYWVFALGNAAVAVIMIILFMLSMLSLNLHHYYLSETPYQLYSYTCTAIGVTFILATLVPYIALSVRRAHDFNQSAWVVLLLSLSFVGFFFLIALGCIPSTEGENNYDS